MSACSVSPHYLKEELAGLLAMQVWNDFGTADSEDAFILVEAVDIFAMLERHLEVKRNTLKVLFMQFLRSQVSRNSLHLIRTKLS